MRIALFSDVHANLPALHAMFEDMRDRQIDAIYCLGDLVGYNVWPNEVIDEIRIRGIATITGNHDVAIASAPLMNQDKGFLSTSLNDIGAVSFEYTNYLVKHDQRSYLASLPTHLSVVFKGFKDPIRLLLVHGSPYKVNEYIYEDVDSSYLIEMMEKWQADIMCFGHTHKPFYKKVSISNNGQVLYKHAINTGSVGKPKDGNPQGGYVIISIHPEKGVQQDDLIHVEFIRFDYDVNAASSAIIQSPLPNEFAEMLMKGC